MLCQCMPDIVPDWVETGHRKGQAEGTKAQEKTPKTNQPKDGHAKTVKAGKQKHSRAKAKGGKGQMEGAPTSWVLTRAHR